MSQQIIKLLFPKSQLIFNRFSLIGDSYKIHLVNIKFYMKREMELNYCIKIQYLNNFNKSQYKEDYYGLAIF